VSVADSMRDIYTQLGLRTYSVRIIRTGWTGGRRGVGIEFIKEQIDILPTPKISSLDEVVEILQPVGLDEVGAINLSEISGRFTEDDLLGRIPNGIPLDKDEQIFYEIEFPRADGISGVKRRFIPRSAPYYNASYLQWSVRLEKTREDRGRNGDLR
jgi:hypothetical protein